MIRNPVMFVVEVVAALTTILLVRDLVTGGGEHRLLRPDHRSGSGSPCSSPTSPRPWPRAAARPRPTACGAPAPRLTAKRLTAAAARDYETVPGTALKVGDVVLVEAGDLIPSDGEVIEGVASVNEAAITGESAPVIRESGGDRSAVTGGTQVLSDWIMVRITAAAGLDLPRPHDRPGRGRRQRQKTPNEIALNILLAGLTHHLRVRGGDHPELRGLRRRRDLR